MIEALLAILKDPGRMWWTYCKRGTLEALARRGLIYLKHRRFAYGTPLVRALLPGCMLAIARELRQRARYEEAQLIEEEARRWQPA